MRLLLLLLLVQRAYQFGVYFLDEEMCDRRLEPGSVIMNSRSERSADRRLRVFRVGGGGVEEEVTSPAVCHPGDTFSVRLTDAEAVDYVLQADTTSSSQGSAPAAGASFEDGGCGGRRVNSKDGALLIPASLESPARVTLVAGNYTALVLFLLIMSFAGYMMAL
jgi:hypothetical protein